MGGGRYVYLYEYSYAAAYIFLVIYTAATLAVDVAASSPRGKFAFLSPRIPITSLKAAPPGKTVCNNSLTTTSLFARENIFKSVTEVPLVPAHSTSVIDLPCTIPIEGAALKLVCGRRCLFIPSRKVQREIDGISPEPDPIPLVILGGMAQSIESWQHHFAEFSRERDVLMFEYLGQGLAYEYQDQHANNSDGSGDGSADGNGKDEMEYFSSVDLEYQAQNFQEIIETVFPALHVSEERDREKDKDQYLTGRIDVVAFSLGARITLATISKSPTLIRKAHLTGVGAGRDEMGKIILKSWEDMLSFGGVDNANDEELRPFAWSILMATCSKNFLAMAGSDKAASWVDHICLNNRRMGLSALLQQTSTKSPFDYCDAITSKSKTIIQFTVGEEDIIATVNEVQKLNDAIGWDDIIVYDGCGHAVLNENTRQWRRDALVFLA